MGIDHYQGKNDLLDGDATRNGGTNAEGSGILITIGTQAGKILVFNVLGLLIHEITLNVPVTVVDWVGDMSAPTILPQRLHPVSLKTSPNENASKDAISDEDQGTVKKTPSPLKATGKRGVIPAAQRPDLFSDASSRHSSWASSRALNGSPSQIQRTHRQVRSKSMKRPRIASETFRSPIASCLHDPAIIGEVMLPKFDNLFMQDATRWLRMSQPSEHRIPRREGQASASQSSSTSSDGSDVLDAEWFTPPSTRRDKSKAPQRQTSPRTPIDIVSEGVVRSPPLRNVSPVSIETPSASPPCLPTSERLLGHDNAKPDSLMKRPRAVQQRVTIEIPNSESPLASPLYSRAASRTSRVSFQPERKDTTPPCPPIPTMKSRTSRVVGTRPNINPSPDSSSSVSSRSISGVAMDRSIRRNASTLDGGRDVLDIEDGKLRKSSTAGRNFSFEYGQHEFEVAGQDLFKVNRRPRARSTKADDIAHLRRDHVAMKQDVDALQEELRVLKLSLSCPESKVRAEADVS